MNLKKIIIYQHNILFDILNEVKEILNFELIKADQKNLNAIKEDLKSNFLIISNSRNENFSNQIVLENLPIKMDKLIEFINLKFLRDTFATQSNITIGDYILDLNSREIIKDSKSANLTEREVNLILFLRNSSSAVKIDKLQKEVWDYGSQLETHTVETHIYRLRKKIKDQFGDSNFIESTKNGYLIN